MNSCQSSMDYSERKKRYQQRKLQMLIFIRDAIERRLAAINASITTLNSQIDKDND